MRRVWSALQMNKLIPETSHSDENQSCLFYCWKYLWGLGRGNWYLIKKNGKARQRGNCEVIKRGGKANLIMAFHLQTRRHLSRVQDTLSQAKQTANEVSFLSLWASRGSGVLFQNKGLTAGSQLEQRLLAKGQLLSLSEIDLRAVTQPSTLSGWKGMWTRAPY